MTLALEWVDGFDLVSYGNQALKYQNFTSFSAGRISPPTGLAPPPDFIGGAHEVGDTGLGGIYFATTPQPYTTRDTWFVNLTVEFKTNGDTVPPYDETYFLYGSSSLSPFTAPHAVKLLTALNDPANGNSDVHLELWAGGDGTNPPPRLDTQHTLLWRSPYTVDHNHRYRFQLKFRYASGTIELWVDGAQVYSATGLAMYGDVGYWALYHKHFNSFGNSGPSFDDYAIFSTSDPAVHLPLPMRVYSVIMGADVSRAWTATPAGPNYQNTYDHPIHVWTEALPDLDSTYVASGGSTAAETYRTGQTIWDASTDPITYLPTVPSFSKVYGIGVNATTRSSGALADSLRASVNGVDVMPDMVPGNTVVSDLLRQYYLTAQWHSIVEPISGKPWLAASIRAANWGVRQTTGDDVRMTAIYLEIVGILGPPPPPPGGGPYIRATGGFALS
jgi:hypothetical protein